MIHAIKGDARKTFSVTAWDLLPKDKCGWKQKAPKEVSIIEPSMSTTHHVPSTSIIDDSRRKK